MSAICLDHPLFADKRYLGMLSTWRAAFVSILRDLGKYGDGLLTDDQLRINICSRKLLERIAEFAGEEDKQWLVRSSRGNLMRGPSLMEQAEDFEDADSLSAGALRMRVDRAVSKAVAAHLDPRLARIEEALGLTPLRTKSRQDVQNSNGDGAQNGPLLRVESAQISAGDVRNGGAEAPSYNSNYASHIWEESSNSNSNSARVDPAAPPEHAVIRSAANPVLSAAIAEANVVDAMIAIGLTESQARHAVKKRTVKDLEHGIDCLRRNLWPQSINPITTMLSYIDGKLKLNGTYLKVIAKEAAEARDRAEKVAQADAAPPLPGMYVTTPAAHEPRRGKTEEERLAEEEAKRKANMEAVAAARASLRPGAAGRPAEAAG